ncbi:MAG: hypothetical protein JO309_09005 [Pseudonocardiales bacterium]|nr:hypothetical protein [Pseudonocardiales bacterium]
MVLVVRAVKADRREPVVAPAGPVEAHRPAALPVPPASLEDPAVPDTAAAAVPEAAEPTGPVAPVALVAPWRAELWTARRAPMATPP